MLLAMASRDIDIDHLVTAEQTPGRTVAAHS